MLINSDKVKKASLAIPLMLALALGACSNDGQSGEAKSEDGVTTITFWHENTGVGEEAINAVVDAFNEKHEDIKVDAVYTAADESQNEKLLAAVAGGNPPDVSWFDRFKVGSWADQGALTDLTEYAKQDGVTKDAYYPFAWEEATYQDKLYAMPVDTDARMLFYNKDAFKEAGLDPENPPKTIAELEDAAEKLTIKDGNRFKQIGFIPWYNQGWLYSWGWSFGGEFFDKESGKVTADDPKIVESLEWMTEYAKKYNVEDITGFTDSSGSGEMDPFLTGQLAMHIGGNWSISGYLKYKPDLNYGVTPIPTPTGDNFTSWSGGMAVVIPKGAPHPDEAWEFVKFFGSEEGQEIYNGIYKTLSVIDSVNEKLGYKDDPIFSEFINILPNSHNRPVIPEGELLWNELSNAVDNSIHGNGTPQELLEGVNEKVNAAIE
ncbi:ABC transporter substrate-binding protein [Virgibacillus oceani]|uniref:Sugar ABC transporter substrate-binding protein n=1 Tax=Virgibacillus oceani TaxID=1479511 RepID=A0A917HLM8_9BACI|nr:ABC transporter substrate-binding protein [Virgibacillus oceani]GGG82714.1 sugar ABC transporter substrate-binding protein [Virgibacillus oceani]